MPNLIKHFYTSVIFAVGQLSFFILLLLMYPGVLDGATLDPEIIWIRSITLIIGSALLTFILAKFLAKYRKNPTRARLNVLLGLIAFLICTTVYFFASGFYYGTGPGPAKMDDLVHDVSRVFLFLATYLFVVFGMTFLLGSEEKKADKFRHVFDLFLIIIYATYVIGEIASIAGVTSELVTDVQSLGEALLLVYGLISLVLIMVIAGKAMSLSKRATDETYKAGLKSLGTSYFFLFAAVMTLLLNGTIDALEENKYIIVLAIGLLIVGFYFIYAGFVRPSSQAASK